MKLRQKIIFLAIVPLILALCAIALAVRHQAISLGQQQRATIQAAYLASKEAELKHYVALATRSIAHLYESGRNDPATLEEAKAILGKLSYGDDGYFFIYDMQGKSLMHPRQPELVGQDLWDMKDANGSLTIRHLIERAKSGGGFERYLWEKPSSHHVAPKLGYVVALPNWGWMLGTGIYLDDVDEALNQIDAQVSGNIRNTMWWITAIAILSALAVGVSGLVLNISEHRVADAKLKVLAQRVVRSQEEERARLSRDLHDGISQWLVSIKLQIEAAIAKLDNGPQQIAAARVTFERTAGQLNDVLGEVRRISHDLRPAILDDLGLAAALDHLTHEWLEHAGIPITFKHTGSTDGMPAVANTVLFRIAQEALTNIARHSQATQINVLLQGDAQAITLTVQDNGVGFDVDQIDGNPKRGIGLRNMVERLEAVGGTLKVSSSAAGTTVLATIPPPHYSYV
ncbi:cache domain-containing protein [Collimonas antrihumi]|uniref:cache domain-containing protein n=1 Tax=Collimonas antrihumi TaxID=1940615 RepID=UPI001B8D7797|nr:cache domain-containing protein [Collimonas antrihumi]